MQLIEEQRLFIVFSHEATKNDEVKLAFSGKLNWTYIGDKGLAVVHRHSSNLSKVSK